MSGIPDVGVVFDTNISLSADKIDINLGETVYFKGVLYAYYRNVSSGNLDFCNTLSDVTLKVFKLAGGMAREQMGTVVTDSNGEFVFDFTPDTEGTHNRLFVCEDTTEYNGCDSSLFNINVGGLHVGLSVSATSVTLGDTVTLTATVLDSETPVSGASVTFYDGSTVIGTGVTDSSGVVTYVTDALSVGNHSLTAHNGNITSSPVYVNVDKVTPTISISAPSTGTVGSAFVVSGTLSVEGTVKLYENNSLKDTLTTEFGEFSKSIIPSSEGTFSYYAVFEATANYKSVTSSTVSVTVSSVAPSYDDIVLSADDSILSYYDGDSTTLRAQLMDGTSTASVSGVTVEFFNGSTSLGTAQTDNNGVATKTYTSTGAGDVSLSAEADNGILVSKIYEVQDCDYYADSTKINGWSNVSSGGEVFKKSTYTIGLSSYSVEIKFNTVNAQLMVGNESSWVAGLSFNSSPYYFYTHTSNGGTNTDTISSPVASDIWRLEVEGTTIRLYRNDNLYTTKTNRKVDYPKNFRLYPSGNASSVAYVKVKPL